MEWLKKRLGDNICENKETAKGIGCEKNFFHDFSFLESRKQHIIL